MGRLGIEYYLSNQADKVWERKDRNLVFRSLTDGTVEIPKLTTKEDREKAHPGPVGEPSDWNKQKIFIRMIREDWQYLTGRDPKNLYLIKE